MTDDVQTIQAHIDKLRSELENMSNKYDSYMLYPVVNRRRMQVVKRQIYRISLTMNTRIMELSKALDALKTDEILYKSKDE